jgi:hypothetical protein
MPETKAKSPLSIGRVVRNAVAFNPRRRRENGVPMDRLLETVSTLFDLLAEREADYLLVRRNRAASVRGGEKHRGHRPDHGDVGHPENSGD